MSGADCLSLPAILHVDETLIVVDKPSGLLSQPGIGPDRRDSVIVRMLRAYPDALIVHRLDRDTSGVMLLARGPKAHRHLSIQFQNRVTQKRYEAIVHGRVVDDAGEIDLPLRKDLENPPRHCVDHERGKPSLTRYRVLERTADRTHLELRPRTGRSHQLRIHLAQLGHPILGDPLYGDAGSAPRMMLHATDLTFTHPATGKRMTCESPFAM